MNTLVRSVTLAKYSTVARGLGIDPVRMVGHVGLDATCLTSPDLRVPEASLAEVLDASARASDCSALGLMVGESWRLSDFGVLGLLLHHQPTLRHALLDIKRYRHLLSDSVVLDVTEYDTVSVVELALVTGRSYPGRQPMELAIGALLSLCRFYLGAQWLPRGVHFSHPAPPQLKVHQRVFGTQLEFGSGFDGIVLSHGELDQANPSSDRNMARYAQDFIDLQTTDRTHNIAHDVRRAVHVLLPRGRNSIEQVGQNLGISPRTLQRQLEQCGHSFQSVVNEVRRQQAQRFLEADVHNVTQVAQLLGFSETSAFSRWFSQQFGVPPSRWKSFAGGDAPSTGSDH